MRGMLVAFTPCRKEKMCVDFLFLTFHGGAGLQVGEVQVGWGDTVAGHLPTRAMGTCASGLGQWSSQLGTKYSYPLLRALGHSLNFVTLCCSRVECDFSYRYEILRTLFDFRSLSVGRAIARTCYGQQLSFLHILFSCPRQR